MRYLNILLIILALANFASSQSNEKSKLTGVVYDANGAIVAGAKVTAISVIGEKFETTTNADGVFVLNLAFSKYDSKSAVKFKEAKYDIVVDSPGFIRSATKAFVFVPSFKGEMRLDIGLEIGPCSDCHWIDADPVKEVKKPIQ
ncbi:MAG: carboxypeptidase-like regulatory domain-containing protein [Blastocatellia bacterium]